MRYFNSKYRLTLGLIGLGILSLAAVGRLLISNGVLMTDLNGNNQSITNLSSVTAGSITNSGLLSTPALATDSNGRIIAGSGSSSGDVLTNNRTISTTFSNRLEVDIAHALIASNATASRVAMIGAEHSLTNATASGAVPIDANGTAATSAQIQTVIGAGVYDPSGTALTATSSITSDWIQGKFPGVILTNGNTVDVTMSNAFRVDAAHALSLSNATASRVAMLDAANQVTNATASGAVPIDADGTATTAAQIAALVTINSSGFTNNVNSQSANYVLLSTDWLVLLTGAHTATLPTAVGIGGKSYIIKCSSAGTNAILTTSSQTIDGAAKWTNTAVNKFTWVISDNANWRVIGQN